MKKILIIQTASIGDVILATPVLEKLHAHFPNASIDFLTKAGNESLFKEHPFLGKILVWNKKQQKYKNLLRLLFYIRDRKYDLVVNMQRFATTGLLTAFSGAEKKTGFSKNPFSLFFNEKVKHHIGNGLHEKDRNHALIRSLTDKTSGPVRLYPGKKAEARMSQYKTTAYICIAPTSLWYTKQYPVDKWIDFVHRLPNELRVYFLGSDADRKICENIIKKSGHANALSIAGELSLLESAALMRDAKMNYVNDSAPQHLASAVNAPVTAIFCSTVPDFGFGPLSEQSHIIQTEVYLPCKPCGLHGLKKCPKKHFKCAKTIRTEQLLNSLQNDD